MTLEPTCTEIGTITRTQICRDCGITVSESTEELPALGHGESVFDEEETTEEGYYWVEYCGRCGIEVGRTYIILSQAPAFEVGSITGRQGNLVTIDVYFRNNPGIASFILQPEYDSSALELISMTASEELGGTFLSSQKAEWQSNENVAFNGVVFTLTFSIAESAEDGEYRVGLSCKDGDVKNKAGESVDCTVNDGYVIVAPEEIAYDINMDGSADLMDVAALFRVLTGAADSSNFNISAGDINGDGSVTLRDVAFLFEILLAN